MIAIKMFTRGFKDVEQRDIHRRACQFIRSNLTLLFTRNKSDDFPISNCSSNSDTIFVENNLPSECDSWEVAMECKIVIATCVCIVNIVIKFCLFAVTP